MRLRQRLRAQIRRANRIGFFDDQLPAGLKTLLRHRPAKSQKQSKHRQNGRVNGRDPRSRWLINGRSSFPPNPVAGFENQQEQYDAEPEKNRQVFRLK